MLITEIDRIAELAGIPTYSELVELLRVSQIALPTKTNVIQNLIDRCDHMAGLPVLVDAPHVPFVGGDA